MLDHQQWAGQGLLEIQDKTDSNNKIVDIWFGSNLNDYRTQDIAWSYKIDANAYGLQNFHFAGPSWKHVSTIYVGFAKQFTLHLEPTPAGSMFVGPVDWTVDLFAGSNTKSFSFKDEGIWKRAIPFVNSNGVWMPAAPYVQLNSEWKEAT